MISLYNKQLKLLFIYAITLLIISPSFGQIDSRTTLVKICDFKGGDKADNACGPGTISGIISKNSSKEVEVTLSAYAVNIPVNQEGNDHVFPSEYPALHLRYQYGVDQFKYTESLINWTLVDEIITNNGEIRTLYRSDQKVNLILPENSECAPESSTIIFPIDIRLYTYSAENDEWEDFPIDNYAAPDDIFSCEVFDNTKHICDPKLKPIDLMSTIDICIPCEHNEDEINFDQSYQPIKIMSNPFSDVLDFNYLTRNASNLTAILYDINGRTISTKYLAAEEGLNKMEISTDAVSKGIYFLSIFDGENNYVQKVICAK